MANVVLAVIPRDTLEMDHFDPDIRKITRNLEHLHLKILKRKHSAVFRGLLLRYTIYIYIYIYIYLATPPFGQDMAQGQFFFKRSLTGLNSEISFS